MGKREREEREMIRDILETPTGAGAPGTQQPPARRSGRGLFAIAFILAILAVALGVVITMRVLDGDNWLTGIIDDVAGGSPAAGAAPLVQTPDAGQAYVDGTLFLGDSNTVRLAHYGLVPEGRVKALSGIGVEGALGLGFTGDAAGSGTTMAEEVARQKPERVLIILGTNDIGVLTETDFTGKYARLLEQLQAASPGTTLIVGAIPPAREGSGYRRLSAEAIHSYNAALLALCREEGVAYLDTVAALSNDGGTAAEGFTEGDGVHLTKQALEALLAYHRTHACQP